jgi:uncharacterized protein
MLIPLGSVNSPADLHGFFCGKLCGGAFLSEAECLQQAWDLLDVAGTPNAESNGYILALYDSTLSDLSSDDYSLQLFLPDDDTEVAVRTQALAQWTQGFLVGFGGAGIDPKTLFSSDNADALRDLAQITQIASVDSDLSTQDDSLEADYFELTEYVRIVALNFYAEYNTSDNKHSPTSLH